MSLMFCLSPAFIFHPSFLSSTFAAKTPSVSSVRLFDSFCPSDTRSVASNTRLSRFVVLGLDLFVSFVGRLSHHWKCSFAFVYAQTPRIRSSLLLPMFASCKNDGFVVQPPILGWGAPLVLFFYVGFMFRAFCPIFRL